MHSDYLHKQFLVSTHSHPKVAANCAVLMLNMVLMFQHTATRRWLPAMAEDRLEQLEFQHTATRRWLHPNNINACHRFDCFNTQPPEGGCLAKSHQTEFVLCFNTQPPEGGCFSLTQSLMSCFQFQHTATRRWLPQNLAKLSSYIEVSTHSHPKVAAPYIKKQEKSAN